MIMLVCVFTVALNYQKICSSISKWSRGHLLYQVHVWDTSSSQLVQRVPAGGVVVDTCTLRLNQQTYLAALTEKTLRIHRWC